MKKIRNSLTILLSISFIVFFNTVNSQELESYQIDSLVSKSMKLMPQQAGIAVAVVKDGKVIHAKGYGIASIKSKDPVDENTLFAIASLSKAFTAAALSILVDEGKLSWQDKVIDYIPEFKMYESYVTENFSIQDLLTHRSGLGDGAGDLLFWPGGTEFTIDDVITNFQYQKPVSGFRTQFDYDNLLYIVAGEVVARISSTSWAEFVQNRIMKPLNMNRSVGLFQNLTDENNIASPHSTVKGELKPLDAFEDPNGILGAAGGIYSSVNDMSKWMLMQLNAGKYGENLNKQLFSEANQNEMWKAHTNIDFRVKANFGKNHFTSYGYGWELKDYNGYVIVKHGGGLPGMKSNITLIPELNIGVVVLTNTDPGGYSFITINNSIINSYLGLEQFDWITSASRELERLQNNTESVTNEVWGIVKNARADNLVWGNFIGTYVDDWFGKVEIFRKDNKLWFKSLRSPKLNGQMFFYQATTFAIKMEYTDMLCDAFATFNLDENGKAISLKMKGISLDMDSSFDFQDLDLKRVDE